MLLGAVPPMSASTRRTASVDSALSVLRMYTGSLKPAKGLKLLLILISADLRSGSMYTCEGVISRLLRSCPLRLPRAHARLVHGVHGVADLLDYLVGLLPAAVDVAEDL